MPPPAVAILGTRGYPSYYGGFETAVRHLSPYLVDHGWDVTVYGRPSGVDLADPTRDHRVLSKYSRGIETESLSTLSYGLTAVLDARRSRPDVALVMNVANGFWIPLLKSRGIPTLVNVDGIEWERDKWGMIAKSVFRAGARQTARSASGLIYDSIEVGRRWQEEFGREGTFIPYGGISHEQLNIEPGLEHRGYVLVVARFVPENSISEFVAAATLLGEKYPIVVVGKGTVAAEEAIANLARRNSRVQWLGRIRNDTRLNSLWQHAGAYFHGHSVGGTNPALVQAMASGAPIVARDTAYNREVLGDAGVFTRPDPTKIAESISSLMEAPAEQNRLSELAIARAASVYGWDRVCAEYDRTLRSLAGVA